MINTNDDFPLQEDEKYIKDGDSVSIEKEDKIMIGRKRQSSRVKKNLINLHNAEQESSCYSVESKNKIKNNVKKKSKKSTLEYFVPVRPTFKSSEALVAIINKVIIKYDHLQILRGYREKVKDDPDFNNFKSKRVEKLLQPENYNPKVTIDFSSANFLIKIKKDFEEVKMDIEKNESEIENLSINNPNNQNSTPAINIRHSELKLISQECQLEIEEKCKNKLISSELLENLDILRYKAESNYYTSTRDFMEDTYSMFKHILNNLDRLLVPFNKESKEKAEGYLQNLFFEMTKLINEADKVFNELFEKDIKCVMDTNKLPKTNSTFKNIPVKKGYQVIDDYHHIFPEITKEKTKTSIKPSCEGGCCNAYEDLGPLNLEKSRWDSKCKDRHNNLECDPNVCGCTNEACKNQSISKKDFKNFGDDVLEKYTWGIDLHTYRNLIEFLPLNFSDEFKAENFIEKMLIKSLSELDVEGYSIVKACKFIIDNIQKNNSNNEHRVELFFAKHLINVFRHSRTACRNSSTAFSKGVGIFCKKEEGIKKNELITIYLGEIYPPWYWYEKQDLIKKNKLDKELPDFYNIMLERLKNDEKGYDLVMVDPNSKGNFASRMSHSCQPNCNTVLMCSNNQYVIGMYATKDILQGDELTFDYNSVTEKEKEFQDAICLCSSFNCRGHYLIYSNSVLFTEVLSKYHTFLHRNTILVQSCNPDFELNKMKQLTKQDEDLLSKYSIRSSILGKAPFWLKKWAALILRYVDLESKMLPLLLDEKNKSNKLPEEIYFDKEKNEFLNSMNGINENIKSKVGIKKQKCDNGDSEVATNSSVENTFSNPPVLNIAGNLIVSKSVSNPKENKKFDFNENFIYPGLKRYQSSRRTKIKIDLSGDSPSISLPNDDCDTQKEMNASSKRVEIHECKENSNDSVAERISKMIKEKKIEKELKAKNEEFTNKVEGAIPEEPSNMKDLDMAIEVSTTNNIESTQPLVNTNMREIDAGEFESVKVDITESESNQNVEVANLNIQTKEQVEKKEQEEYNSLISITENRIQNIAITIDKVLHVLDLMKIDEPPLELLSEREVIDFHWGKGDSIRSHLERNINNLLQLPEFLSISSELTENFKKMKKMMELNKSHHQSYLNNSISNFPSLETIRENLKFFSKLLKKCKNFDKTNKFVFYQGLSDILFLHANTKVYFKNNKNYDRKNAISERISIRQRDINTNACGVDLDSTVCQGEKTYDKLYIWGQLAGWYKQTVDKPNASLSAERRGSLSYPDIDSFFIDFEKYEKKMAQKFDFPYSSRKTFYMRLLENPSLLWPVGNDWSFKNKNKIYGTVQFDSIYMVNSIEKVEDSNSYFLNILKSMEE